MKSLVTKSSRLRFLALCAFVCFCGVTTIARGQEPQIEESQEVLTDLERKMQKIVTIDAKGLPIETVMRQLVDQTDVDLIMSPNVTGDVTVSLTDVSLKEALQSILDVHGAAYIPGDNVIRILPRDEMPQVSERIVTEMFQVVHVDVKQVVAALEKFISPAGQVSFIEGTNYVILTDTESKVRDMGNLLYKIDAATRQVLVEVRIYDITSQDNLDLGVEWHAGRRTNRDFTGAAIEDDIIVQRGGADTFVSSRTDPSLTSAFGGATGKTADSTLGILRLGLLNESIDVEAQLSAEKENIDAKLLANPRILVIDKQQAVFDIVTQHPYIERTITSAGITETVQFKDVGVKLVVTPNITTNRSLRMHIMPEFGIVVGQVQVSSSNVPIVDTRKFDTTAVVNDGQTVVLGGLRKKDTTMQTNKIPLLGDIPILGHLEGEQQAYEVTEFSGPAPMQTKHERGAAIAR
ncbi:MAG: secretin N-terminal domain-containing protein [Planctomycetota bacterium]